MKLYSFTAHIQRDTETNLYVGIVPDVPGVHTQAASLDELYANLQEVLQLCIEESGDSPFPQAEFVGTQQISIAV